MNKFIQFQLWRDCNSGCRFCYNNQTNQVDKLAMIEFTIDRLKHDDIGACYRRLGLIGGEFFDKQLNDSHVRKKFYELIDLIINLIKSKRIDQLCVTTSLIYKDTTELKYFIDKFVKNDVVSNLLICTSFDTVYRFHNDAGKRVWHDNMISLAQNSNNIKTHVEIILTEHFLNEVINDKFNIKLFEQQYNTRVDFIDCQYFESNQTKQSIEQNLPLFVPKRKTFLKFVTKLAKSEQYNINDLLNPNLHSNTIYIENDGNILCIDDRLTDNTKSDQYYHSLNRKSFKIGYVDDNVHDMRKDVETILMQLYD